MDLNGFIKHPMGVFVNADGLVFVPKNHSKLEHFTYGYKNKKGYLEVKCNKKHCTNVGKLVLECFVGEKPSDKHTCDHINRDKTDNRLENLRWATKREQVINRDTSNFKNKKGSKKVLQLTLDDELVKEWESIGECGRNGFSRWAVSACCRNLPKYLTHKGYKWKWGDC